MQKLCIPNGFLIIWFNLLTFDPVFTKACFYDAATAANNITYPTAVSWNDVKYSSHRDQTTSRANTLSDDADDLQMQLENEARDRMRMGRPKTIWVFHLPRSSEPEDQFRTKRDLVKPLLNKANKKMFRQYTNEPTLITEMILEPTTADLEPLLNSKQIKGYIQKQDISKNLIDSYNNFSNFNTKTENPFEYGKSYKRIKDGRISILPPNLGEIENLTIKENKHKSTHTTPIDEESLHKVDKFVEKAKNLTSSMPIVESFTPDHFDSDLPKKTNQDSKNKNEKAENKCDTKIDKIQPKWSYRSQMNWSQSYPNCAGIRQSPISIPVQLLISTKGARDLCFDNFDVLPTMLTLCVGECRLAMAGQWELKNWPTVYGGAAHSRRYKFHSMTAMWPSEHKIEGMLYPMETQFTFIGVEYSSMDDALEAAMKDPQSLLTIATFYKFGKISHAGAADLLKSAMASTCDKCDCKAIQLKPLGYFCPPFKKYAVYYGSLTTPPCTESVLWLLRAKALNVTWDMYQSLLRVSTSGAFFIRETQPLNDRKIFFFD